MRAPLATLRNLSTQVATAALLFLLCCSPWCAAAPVGQATNDLERAVLPVFTKHCYKCHGPEKQKGGLRLDSTESLLKGGESGEPAVVPGASAKSRLMGLVTSTNSEHWMPPKGERLPAGDIDVLRRWIDGGAPLSATTNLTARSELVITEEDRSHWSFHPLASPKPPTVRGSKWARTPIDDFVLWRLSEKGIKPNPEAERRVLIRRVYFDLIGLPPTPEQIDAFVADKSSGAYETLVDRLLENPHFGERWGRHWLDAVRYADSAGFEEDRPRPTAYHYRDFVIRSFNEDLPYDQFLRWQIAGDLIAPREANVFAAAGFITASPDVRPDFANFRKKDRYDELDDIVSTVGGAMLGLTLGCARCHDHKYDPVPTRDYYRLLAFFNPVERAEKPLNAEEGETYERDLKAFEEQIKPVRDRLADWLNGPRHSARLAKIEALAATDEEKSLLRAEGEAENPKRKELLERFKSELKVDDEELRKKLPAESVAKWDQLKSEVGAMEAKRPKDVPRVLTARQGPPKQSFLLPRGDSDAESQTVSPGFLSVLLRSHGGDKPPAEQSRVDLAKWLTDPADGAGALAGRVIVNRLWQHHFGRGLVETPGDFGIRGSNPTHPELLDYLVSELVRGGWHLKPLHKMILMSAVYRQSAAWDEERAKVDPEDHLWWRRRPNRVEGEILRDGILFVSGCLNTNMFGPAVKPPIHPDAITAVTDNYDRWPRDAKDGPETWRRGVYVFVKRANLFPFFQAFDAPNAIGTCSRRNPTTVTPQALTLLNDQFIRNQARMFARRVVWESPQSGTADRIVHAWRLALGRNPSQVEINRASRFIREQQAQHELDSGHSLNSSTSAGFEALADFCQTLFASNEFSYID